MLPHSQLELAKIAINTLQESIYYANVKAGWYKDPKTGRKINRNRAEMIALIHSELSEGLEGLRKNLADDHLPDYPMIIVELADALVRIFDLAGYMQAEPPYPITNTDKTNDTTQWRLGDAFVAKVLYNGQRADHKLSERAKEGGKKI